MDLSLSEKRMVRFVNFSLICCLGFCFLCIIINFVLIGWQESIIPFVFFLLFSSGFYYQQRQQIHITKLLVLGITNFGITICCWLFGLKGYPYFLFLLSFSAGMVFYPKKKQQIQLLFIQLFFLALTLGLAPYITPIMEVPRPFLFGVMTFLFVLFLFFFIIYSYTQANELFEHQTNKLVSSLKTQKTQIEHQSDALISFNQLLQKEIEAKNIIEEQLKKSNEQLKRFVYVASHDLKEPLRSIGSFTYLLDKELGENLNETNKEYLNFVSGGVKRMSVLLDDLLSYSRVENATNFPKTTINLNALIANLKANLTSLIKSSNGTILIDKELPAIYGCATQINQLFQNLISNALKFKGNNPPLIKISWKESADNFTFSVQDNGIGIPKQYQSKIFDAFERIDKNKYEGSGIGLATCETVAKNHNGKIWLTSEIDKGTTFYFTIPKVNFAEIIEL